MPVTVREDPRDVVRLADLLKVREARARYQYRRAAISGAGETDRMSVRSDGTAASSAPATSPAPEKSGGVV